MIKYIISLNSIDMLNENILRDMASFKLVKVYNFNQTKFLLCFKISDDKLIILNKKNKAHLKTYKNDCFFNETIVLNKNMNIKKLKKHLHSKNLNKSLKITFINDVVQSVYNEYIIF